MEHLHRMSHCKMPWTLRKSYCVFWAYIIKIAAGDPVPCFRLGRFNTFASSQSYIRTDLHGICGWALFRSKKHVAAYARWSMQRKRMPDHSMSITNLHRAATTQWPCIYHLATVSDGTLSYLSEGLYLDAALIKKFSERASSQRRHTKWALKKNISKRRSHQQGID